MHVERESNRAKFWLDPIRLEHNYGFARVELNRIGNLVEENIDDLLRSWNEFFEPTATNREGAEGDGH